MKKRKPLAHFGPIRGGVRVLPETRDGVRIVMVRWRQHGAPHQQSYPDTPEGRAEAVAFARGVAEGGTLAAAAAPPTVGALWRLYAEAEFPALRPRSRTIYRARWRLFEVFAGHDRPSDQVALELLDAFAANLRKLDYAPNQVAHHLRMVKIVFRWGRARRLVAGDVPDYRIRMGKDERAAEPDEYRDDEYQAILGALDPRRELEWRPWAVLMLVGHQGVRMNAALHLRWTDIEGAAFIWPAQHDKVGRTWRQPMRWGALAAIETARRWRARAKYSGLWVFPTARPGRGDEPYTAQALYYSLRKAERKAGVVHHDLRGLHGLRRKVAGDIYALTGNEKAALDFIGDRDPRLIPKYLRERPGALAELAARVDAEENRRPNGDGTSTAPAGVAEAVLEGEA